MAKNRGFQDVPRWNVKSPEEENWPADVLSRLYGNRYFSLEVPVSEYGSEWPNGKPDLEDTVVHYVTMLREEKDSNSAHARQIRNFLESGLGVPKQTIVRILNKERF